jgi:hypothetical protein
MTKCCNKVLLGKNRPAALIFKKDFYDENLKTFILPQSRFLNLDLPPMLEEQLPTAEQIILGKRLDFGARATRMLL